MATAASEKRARSVSAALNYLADMEERPRFFAVDHARDRLPPDTRTVAVSDARSWSVPPDLDREGFTLVHHRSKVRDFRDQDELMNVHRGEIEALLQEISGADQVVLTAPGGFRFSERSPHAGKLVNSAPARHIHIDFSDATARHKAALVALGGLEKVRRFAHYNVWRALSPPPQDTPLAVCDARSVDPRDLVPIDFVYDAPNRPEWSFEGLVVKHNPAHRWVYWSNMRRDEALIFKTNDSDPTHAHAVPHSAFDDPTCPPGAPPRASIEMRGVALWYR